MKKICHACALLNEKLAAPEAQILSDGASAVFYYFGP